LPALPSASASVARPDRGEHRGRAAAHRTDLRAGAEGAFQDADFEVLFDARLDGLEDDDWVADLALANLRFEEWFRPFRDGVPIHPYVAEE
jgi:hypothetical protein